MTTNSVEAQTQAETQLDPLIFAVIIAAAVVVLCLVAAGVMLYGFVFHMNWLFKINNFLFYVLRYKWFGTDDDNENIKPYGQSTNNNDSVEIAWEDIMAEADVFKYILILIFFMKKVCFICFFWFHNMIVSKALGPPSETSTQVKFFFEKQKEIFPKKWKI